MTKNLEFIEESKGNIAERFDNLENKVYFIIFETSKEIGVCKYNNAKESNEKFEKLRTKTSKEEIPQKRVSIHKDRYYEARISEILLRMNMQFKRPINYYNI